MITYAHPLPPLFFSFISPALFPSSQQRILQDYVDSLFRTIFASPRVQTPQLPRAIKYLFDFLDQQAAEIGISDPEVLHTWKTNR